MILFGHFHLLIRESIPIKTLYLFSQFFVLGGGGGGSVFLFGILGMGAGPSELGKSACEIWKLGKVEICLKL